MFMVLVEIAANDETKLRKKYQYNHQKLQIQYPKILAVTVFGLLSNCGETDDHHSDHEAN